MMTNHKHTAHSYRTDQYGSVYEYSAEHDAYLFIGKLNGRTLAQFLADRDEYQGAK
jgi:hypothetical protein